jgi:Fe(II)/alpha-ketoglutarate-dependent arginine beta-hydroxylase
MTAAARDLSLVLDSEEARATADLVRTLSGQYTSSEDEQLLRDVPFLAERLPERTRRFLRGFRLEEPAAWCVIRGHRIDDARLGPTPARWDTIEPPGTAFAEEIVLVLYGSLLGEPFGWRTQQNGRLIHDVLPILGHELEPISSGSEAPLTWHTEDAFHPHRSDYLLLAALRNPDRVPTLVGELDVSRLDPADMDVLFEPRFLLRPDESHLPKNNTAVDGDHRPAFDLVQRLISDPEPAAVLFGDRRSPYLRLDPCFMDVPAGDVTARRAFAALVAVLDESMRPVTLDAGDVLALDNYRAVHGRPAFRARRDGHDRWLKRMNVTRDLRHSRAMRSAPAARLIG